MDNSISLLRGRIYEAMDNRGLAADCFRRALHQDVYCFEAFDLLVSHHMLSAQEGEKGFVEKSGTPANCNRCRALGAPTNAEAYRNYSKYSTTLIIRPQPIFGNFRKNKNLQLLDHHPKISCP